jgi:hypothetical protein
MKTIKLLSVLLALTIVVSISACGGSGSSGVIVDNTGTSGTPPAQTLSVQESQRYFPLSDGNLWTSHEAYSVNGSVTTSFDRTSQRNGTKLIGGLVASVMSVKEVPSNSIYENYLQYDNSGISVLGTNNNNANPPTNNYTPYRLISFPIQIGVSVRQLNKKNVDYGFDFDGDGINEKIDITIDVVADGYEAITTTAGTFNNCLRVVTSQTEILTLSSTGNKISAVSTETTWYAQDIGQVKQVTRTFGNGLANQITEELTGYMVDGRSNKLSLQVSPQTATISAGSTVQLTVSLINSANSVVMTIPAKWASSDTAIATVNATGLVTGIKSGTAAITPTVGGVKGPSATISVLIGMKPGLNYPSLSVQPTLYGGNTAIGDLNGDGRNDIAVMESYNSRYRVLIYYQNSNGTFDPPQVIVTSLSLLGIKIHDMNNDGFSDLVLLGTPPPAFGATGQFAIYKQNPITHTLDAPQQYAISTTYPYSLDIADLNHDGLPDIVVASQGSGNNGLLSFYFQGPNGSLSPEYKYTSVAIAGGEVHVGDLNGDGLNDVVVKSGRDQLAVIRQLTAGIFSTVPDYYTVQTRNSYTTFVSFALGDLNGDGLTDIATVDTGNSANINIFLQNANGTLSPPTAISIYSNPLAGR